MSKPILYHCVDARSLRCLWTAEELGLDFELVTMRFPPRFHVPEFKQVNPLGTIPCWVDGDLKLTESAAICQLMARGTPLEVTPDGSDYAAYLNWLHRSDATLTFPLAVMIRYTAVEPPERRLPQAVEDYKAFFLGRLRSVEEALSDGRDWLVAGRFTIADICVGFALFLGQRLGLKPEYGPASTAWLDRLVAREAFLSAQSRERG